VTGNIFSIKVLKPKYLLALFLLTYAASVIYLQGFKAPWVDEFYSYYGVWHDSFSEFYNSMLTGINFSPPLYFLFNFCLQLIFQTSIEQLRIQSLAFIIIGIVLCFLSTRKIFGTTIAFCSTILVASQSNLLLSQAQEARHYAMFFACGSWVLYSQSLDAVSAPKNKWLTFLSHFCLCQVHYLGIIFSGLVILSWIISNKDKSKIQKNPFPVFTSCPNYTVPYEPHFGIPLIPFFPKLTPLIFKKCLNSELWNSLNFISTFKLQRIITKNNLVINYHREVLYKTFRRIENDSEFRQRQSNNFIKYLFFFLSQTRLINLTRFIPPEYSTPMVFELKHSIVNEF